MTRGAESTGITLTFAAPYHPAANVIADRAISDIKHYIHLYPNFPGGWKCSVEAAVTHQNRSHISALGRTPQYAAFGTPSYLPADEMLGLTTEPKHQEIKRTAEGEMKNREAMKRFLNRCHNTSTPSISPGDLALVRKGCAIQAYWTFRSHQDSIHRCCFEDHVVQDGRKECGSGGHQQRASLNTKGGRKQGPGSL